MSIFRLFFFFFFFFFFFIVIKNTIFVIKTLGGDQNLERRNVERSIFRNFKIANIKVTKDELFDNFMIDFLFFIFDKLFKQPE